MIQVKGVLFLAKPKGHEHNEKSETVEGAVKIILLAITSIASTEAHDLATKLRKITNVIATKTKVKKSTNVVPVGFAMSAVEIESRHTLVTATVAKDKLAQFIALLSDKDIHIDCGKQHLAQLNAYQGNLVPHITSLYRALPPAKLSVWQSVVSLWGRRPPTSPLPSVPSISMTVRP